MMSGGLFSGHEESGGELVEVDGKKFKEFYMAETYHQDYYEKNFLRYY